MGFGDITNIILAAVLLLFGLRNIYMDNTTKDYSNHKNLLLKWFFSRKEYVAAIHIARALGFRTTEELRKKIKTPESYDYRGAINIISKCIIKAETDAYTYSSGSKHESPYYVDSMGFSQNKDNCKELYNVLLHLISKSKIKDDYEYVFSIKGGNIPLATAFSMDNNSVLSIIAKDRNEKVNSGSSKDSLINYEGLRDLVEKAKDNTEKIIKGIAVACNLANGSNLLDAIKAYNESIKTLKDDGTIPQNIKEICNVYILYRAITGGELDNKYEEAGLICYRYFDLNDLSKACLYNIQKGVNIMEDFICYKCIKGKKQRNCNAKYCYKSLK